MPPALDQLGRPLHDLRISVTDRCNLKCSYCMPQSPVHVEREEVMTFEEIHRLVGVAVSLGWRKVRLTGGEPLVRKGIIRFMDRLNQIKKLEEITLTTNGVLLKDYARDLRDCGPAGLPLLGK